MNPNTFLRTLWRSETKDQGFVAMSFEPCFMTRFDERAWLVHSALCFSLPIKASYKELMNAS